MNGILVVDKPQGFTSFDVVAKLRGICGTKKIGHGGTLDPMATGVLPVFVGAAAKAVDLAPDTGKEYEAQVLLGVSTDSGDITGAVVRRAEKRAAPDEIKAVLGRLTGPRMQTPPMVSAVKVGGKALYKYAREGKTVERKARPITVYGIDFMGMEAADRFSIRVRCSKGTYIRVLAQELGEALGLPATLAALRRTRSGCFTLAGAHTLKALQAAKDAGKLEGLLLETQLLFEGLPRLYLSEQAAGRLINGAAVSFRGAVSRTAAGLPGGQGEAAADAGANPPGGAARVCLFTPGGFLGLGRLAQGGLLKTEKLFIDRT